MPIPPFLPIFQNHPILLNSGGWVLVYDIKLEYSSSAALCQNFRKFDKKHSKVFPVLRYQDLTSLGPLKVEFLSSPPLPRFENLVGCSTPQQEGVGGAHYAYIHFLTHPRSYAFILSQVDIYNKEILEVLTVQKTVDKFVRFYTFPKL